MHVYLRGNEILYFWAIIMSLISVYPRAEGGGEVGSKRALLVWDPVPVFEIIYLSEGKGCFFFFFFFYKT